LEVRLTERERSSYVDGENAGNAEVEGEGGIRLQD
jgi:hypothetical protein